MCYTRPLKSRTRTAVLELSLEGRVGRAAHGRAQSSLKVFLFPILVSPCLALEGLALSPPNRTTGFCGTDERGDFRSGDTALDQLPQTSCLTPEQGKLTSKLGEGVFF